MADFRGNHRDQLNGPLSIFNVQAAPVSQPFHCSTCKQNCTLSTAATEQLSTYRHAATFILLTLGHLDFDFYFARLPRWLTSYWTAPKPQIFICRFKDKEDFMALQKYRNAFNSYTQYSLLKCIHFESNNCLSQAVLSAFLYKKNKIKNAFSI